ncbi:YqaJ viral recombinase family protein [Budviciaceae bacterium CWB-B4]|uniref:YqaJ viral recombinase family protein n=1 Tax=Limnobaculum xujianqingii TaxID=2738837 RepID=A0A9D7AM51_9GAMM|nr:lambda exonuclease family protein [Limnobaculum xujianqingii]MBK5075173.1 YqaJ viral recombinase family protein [Limnobaculum xujianqingii]MBK5178479.1 YqaJ viral recombinase family protein [Limnobaculum xujianqingii]
MQWHNVQQNTEEWEQLRIGKVTASSFGCIMANNGKAFGEPAKRYALQIALEIVTGNKAEFSFSNEHMERGHEQEPIARMLYEELNFTDVTNGGFFDCGDYGDSPDGLIDDDGVIEIKSVTAAIHYATLQRKSFDPAYRWQLIGHLDCAERQWVDFVSYCSDFPKEKQLITHRLNRPDFTSEIIQLRERRSEFINLIGETIKAIS